MASVKIATLLIRTIAKPISGRLKTYAQSNETFRNVCISLAQGIYRSEVRLRRSLLGEEVAHGIRPLSDARAIENGANALAEGFLFGVAASIIIAETWRSSRNETKRRDRIDDEIEQLQEELQSVRASMDKMKVETDTRFEEERQRNEELTRILTRIVEIGLRGGWAELDDTPLRVPRIGLIEEPNRPLTPPSDEYVGEDSSRGTPALA